ncbi:MAG: YdeI/OmpD-associated family protein [Anaerolineae bacterium]|nr:YdeI/OmpD-associated family protein [Anaerolineae bacterium]
MKITQTLYVHKREEWRAWLMAHYQTERDIWFIFYRKGSGQPSLPYNDAVEEALCFGWIDSIVKSLDDERRAQRFSPRQPKSSYSQLNIERLRRLVAQGLVMPEVQASLGDMLTQPFVIPPDILAVMQATPQVWANFQRYSEPYQRIRIAFIDSARSRSDEFEKRLNYFLRLTAQDKQFGYGIESYY